MSTIRIQPAADDHNDDDENNNNDDNVEMSWVQKIRSAFQRSVAEQKKRMATREWWIRVLTALFSFFALEAIAVFCSNRIAGWLLPPVEGEEASIGNNDNGGDNNDDYDDGDDDDVIPYDGSDFVWYLLIVFVVSLVLQCCFLCSLLACCFFGCRRRKESLLHEEAERGVESNALMFDGNNNNNNVVPPLLSLLANHNNDIGDEGACCCSFEATCHLASNEPYYSAKGELTIRRIDHPSSQSAANDDSGSRRNNNNNNPLVLYYGVSGHGHDTEGPFRIEHGRMSPSGMFFWIQKPAGNAPNTTNVLRGKKRGGPRLVTGLVDTDGASVRRGYWQKESGEGDGYSKFDLLPTDQRQQSSGSFRDNPGTFP